MRFAHFHGLSMREIFPAFDVHAVTNFLILSLSKDAHCPCNAIFFT